MTDALRAAIGAFTEDSGHGGYAMLTRLADPKQVSHRT